MQLVILQFCNQSMFDVNSISADVRTSFVISLMALAAPECGQPPGDRSKCRQGACHKGCKPCCLFRAHHLPPCPLRTLNHKVCALNTPHLMSCCSWSAHAGFSIVSEPEMCCSKGTTTGARQSTTTFFGLSTGHGQRKLPVVAALPSHAAAA